MQANPFLNSSGQKHGFHLAVRLQQNQAEKQFSQIARHVNGRFGFGILQRLVQSVPASMHRRLLVEGHSRCNQEIHGLRVL